MRADVDALTFRVKRQFQETLVNWVILRANGRGYGLMYAISPEFRAAHESLGSAMAQGASDSYGQIKDLIFGDEKATSGANLRTGASTDTATGEARCPATPFWHSTDLCGRSNDPLGAILLQR